MIPDYLSDRDLRDLGLEVAQREALQGAEVGRREWRALEAAQQLRPFAARRVLGQRRCAFVAVMVRMRVTRPLRRVRRWRALGPMRPAGPLGAAAPVERCRARRAVRVIRVALCLGSRRLLRPAGRPGVAPVAMRGR